MFYVAVLAFDFACNIIFFFLTLHPFQFASTVREGHGPTTSVRCLLGSHFLTYELYKKIAFPNPVMLPGCVNPATTNSKIFMAKNISIAVPSFRRASSASNSLLWKIVLPDIKKAPLDYVFWPTTCSSHWCGKKNYLQIDGSSFQSADNEKPISHAHSYESSYLSKVHPAHGPN